MFEIEPTPEDNGTIAFASQALKSTEEQFITTESNGKAVCWALGKLHIWLVGKPILVRTDNVAFMFMQIVE